MTETNNNPTGTLFGIGVGPGDPGLITLKAIEILGEVDDVFTASASEGEDSLAGTIAKPHLRPGVELKKLVFPMTKDAAVLENAWKINAETVIKRLKAGRSVAFLTLGDCLIYSTYSYLLRHLFALMPEAKVRSIPGIASYQSAAAKLNRPLTMGRETLTVLGGATDGHFETLCRSSDNLVILKSYRDIDDTVETLKKLGLAEKTALCSNISLEGETIVCGLEKQFDNPNSYFSLLLVNKRKNFKES
jgi:precorrin-2/cobalt-factor-2 C20-methyltransferase